jgi:hypothetical protein
MSIKLGGIFKVMCKDLLGNMKWIEEAHNLVVNVGLNHVLNVVFNEATQEANWYIGLKNAGSIAATDSLNSHPGWTEFSDYSEGARQLYNVPETSSQSLTNSSNKATFSISGSGTIAGAIICSEIGGTSGILLCAADFASSRSVISGDTLEVTYEFSASDSGV